MIVDPKLAKARAKRDRKLRTSILNHESNSPMAQKLKAAVLAKAV